MQSEHNNLTKTKTCQHPRTLLTRRNYYRTMHHTKHLPYGTTLAIGLQYPEHNQASTTSDCQNRRKWLQPTHFRNNTTCNNIESSTILTPRWTTIHLAHITIEKQLSSIYLSTKMKTHHQTSRNCMWLVVHGLCDAPRRWQQRLSTLRSKAFHKELLKADPYGATETLDS
eukprot:4574489-Amphidinium_carterae.1